MCGIFAYMGNQPIKITQVIQVLRSLETDQEPGEPTPVGGHGAGIAYQNPNHKITLIKVAKTNGSPTNTLKQQLLSPTASSSIILAHVRRASPQFLDTIQYAECTQPYQPQCRPDLTILTAHNGYVENYQQLKTQLTGKHNFESEQIKLIDSEVIAHIIEEQVTKTKKPTKATHTLYGKAQGPNTIVTLHTHADQAHLNVIHKGKTRGLTTWTDPENAVLLCSRQEPIQTTFNTLLKENNYQQIIHITRNDTANLEAHFTINTPTQSPLKSDE